jgi:hypothetical protein
VNSIFQRSNPAIEKLFAEAGSPKKVMCVPIDYAKRQHTALICNGEGMQLRGPFNIHNNPAGLGFLEAVMAGLCRKHAIHKQHIFFGGEDCSTFCFNFIQALLQRGYLGIGLNSRDAAGERENQVASTDKLDLLGIASLLINKKRGRTLSTEYGPARILRELTHYRGALVKAHVAGAYRMHHLVDQLLPGFLNQTTSPLTPFSEASLWLMRERFSPRQLLLRKSPSLAEKLRRFRVQEADAKVAQLKALACSVLPPPAGLCETLQANLAHEVSIYQHLSGCLAEVEQDIARRLAATPGAMLTTVPGIGITLAAVLYAEIGEPSRQRPLTSLTAYAGLVARLKQTGGPDKEARTRGRSRRACVPLKRCLLDIALKIGQFGHEELKTDYRRRENAHQDVRFTMARRMLRICYHLIQHVDFFLPPSLLQEADPAVRRQYYQEVWDQVLIKWRNAAAIQQAFAPEAPMEQWRQALNELYGLNLSKLSP